jgi:hypothetical protein
VPPLVVRHGHPSACHFAEVVKPLTLVPEQAAEQIPAERLAETTPTGE